MPDTEPTVEEAPAEKPKKKSVEHMDYADLRKALGDKAPDKDGIALIDAWNARWAETRGKYRYDEPKKVKPKKVKSNKTK